MLASRMFNLGTETAFEVFARAQSLESAGRSIVHLELGEPDFDTPRFIREAAVLALDEGYTHYAPAQGLPVFREAAAEYLSESRGVRFDPDNIVVTPGAKPILFFTILALVDSGDEVIYPDPGFPIYESVTRFVGGTPIPVKLQEENGFRLDVADLKKSITPRTKLIILNSPHNPTGSVLQIEDLQGIAEIIDGTDIMVLSDEVYSHILYEGDFASLASLPGMQDRVILLEGHSKTYAMTGWRLGYAAVRSDLVEHFTKLMTNSNSCVASFVQVAGAAALRGCQDSVRSMVAELNQRRDVLVSGLNAIPRVSCVNPSGAFYVFPNVSRIGMSSQKIADYLLQEAGVALLSGTCFGAHGEGFLRLSYANSLGNIREALHRMEKALTTL